MIKIYDVRILRQFVEKEKKKRNSIHQIHTQCMLEKKN